jgi:hypothetical protein
MLAKLTSPMEATQAAQAFNAYLPMLESFPDAAFTHASLDFVASECRHGVPTYADVRRHLGAWWKRNRPPVPELTAPVKPLPSLRTPEEAAEAHRTTLRAMADLKAQGERHNAAFLKATGQQPLKAHYASRAELTEMYKRAGLKGPEVQP